MLYNCNKKKKKEVKIKVEESKKINKLGPKIRKWACKYYNNKEENI